MINGKLMKKHFPIAAFFSKPAAQYLTPTFKKHNFRGVPILSSISQTPLPRTHTHHRSFCASRGFDQLCSEDFHGPALALAPATPRWL